MYYSQIIITQRAPFIEGYCIVIVLSLTVINCEVKQYTINYRINQSYFKTTFQHSKYIFTGKRKKKQEEDHSDDSEDEMAPPSKKSKKSTSINLLSIDFGFQKGWEKSSLPLYQCKYNKRQKQTELESNCHGEWLELVLNFVATTIPTLFALMWFFASDNHDTGVVMFGCAQISPRVFSSLETVTVSYKNCDNFITKGFQQKPLDPCII